MAAGRAPLLSLEAVAKSYGGRPILSDIHMSVSAGEVVTLIGPNGAGKSTLVRIALGLVRPDSGRVTRAPGLTIGYMPQKVHIDPLLPLTAERFLRLRPGVSRAAIRESFALVGLSGREHAPVQGLSGGEFQKLILARAILGRPQLLVLDEPVQGVDITGQAALYRLILEMRDRLGCAVLMISHDLHLVMSGTDRVICLNQHICCSGAPHAVRVDPAYRARVGADANMLALYAHDPRHDHRHDHYHDCADPSHSDGRAHHDH